MNSVKTRTAPIFMDEDDILHIVMHENAEMDYEDAVDNYLVARNLSGGKPMVKLIDSRLPWKIDGKARKFLNRKEVKEQTIARAVVVDSAIMRLLNSFLVSVSRSPVPVKIFTDMDEARAWLLITRAGQQNRQGAGKGE